MGRAATHKDFLQSLIIHRHSHTHTHTQSSFCVKEKNQKGNNYSQLVQEVPVTVVLLSDSRLISLPCLPSVGTAPGGLQL